MNYQGNPIPVQDIQKIIQGIVDRNSEVIEQWVAELQGAVSPNSILSFFENVPEGEATRKEREFTVRFNKILTNKQILDFLILSYYLPKLPQSLIMLAIDEVERKRSLHFSLPFRVHGSGKIYSLLYLSYHQMDVRSFSGRVGNIMKMIEKDVNSSKPQRGDKIFQSFWSPYPTAHIEKYTGYCRGYRDHGTLRPSNYHNENFLEDQLWYDAYERTEQRKKDLEDSIDFLLGSII